MDDTKINESLHHMSENNGLLKDHGAYLNLDSKNIVKSLEFFINLMKFSLLLAADKLLMARKPLKEHSFDLEPKFLEERKTRGEFELEESEMVSGKYDQLLIQSSSSEFDDTMDLNEDYVDESKMVNYPSGRYNEFPLNFLSFLVLLMLKFVGFQINLLVKFFILPIWFTYFSFMFLMFPFQTLLRIKRHLTKKMLGFWDGFCFRVTSFIWNQFGGKKSIVNLVVRIGWGCVWSVYVWLLLVGLLVSGFVIGNLVMRCLVEEPIQTTEALNFDYTKTNPVAFVPIMSSPDVLISSTLMSKKSENTAEHVGTRIIPYNHKLKLTVSLIMPESDYNRRLGVFQVRVEFLAANGKTTASSSYPSMLRFKSQPIRIFETIVKSVPVIAGFQSEVQYLDIKFRDFTEGYEPTSCLKVIIEQRAEYESGAGIPEIYSATLNLESELPQVKKIIWNWRSTIFIWTSIMSFLTELLVILIFFRPIIIPRGRLRAITSIKVSRQTCKSI